jgi:tetratricopeptide (TPR) repeat protein
MAVVYEKQGKYDEALDLYHKAEKVRVAVYGHAHPDVALTKQNIGLVFRSTNRKQEAKEMFKQAADIRRQVFGPAHALTKESEGLASE